MFGQRLNSPTVETPAPRPQPQHEARVLRLQVEQLEERIAPVHPMVLLASPR